MLGKDEIERFFRGRMNKSAAITAVGAATAALLFGGGTNTTPIQTGTPGVNFIDFRTETTDATGADSRGLYLRHYLSGAGGSGEAARLYTTVNAAGAVGAHGAHISLNFGATGTVTGEAAAARATLEVPNANLGGTTAAVYAELFAAGTSSAITGNAAFFRAVLGGNATGAAAVEDSAFLLSIEGGTNSSGNVVGAQGNEPTWASHTHLVRIKINGTTAYIPVITL